MLHQRGKARIKRGAIGQIGQEIVRCQVTDLLLCAVAFGYIEGDRNQSGPALIEQRPRFNHDFDEGALGRLVDDGFVRCPGGFCREPTVVAEVVLRHREQVLAPVTVMAAHCGVDRQQPPCIRIGHPHRQRILLEQQPERSLAAFEVGDIDTDPDAATVGSPPLLDPDPSVSR